MHEKASLMRTEAFVQGYPTKWAPQPFERTDPLVAASLPIWHVAKGWVLLFPMLYLAMNGNILPILEYRWLRNGRGQRQFIRA